MKTNTYKINIRTPVKTETYKIEAVDEITAKKILAYLFWRDLEDALFLENKNDELVLEEDQWHGFPKGTFPEEIWDWFEETFDISVGKDLLYSTYDKEIDKLIGNNILEKNK